uniref:Uncharacterized protein n=1 Tax=Parascaris univalens TaxID=6257 RepID=A0A915CIJ4_PARUN
MELSCTTPRVSLASRIVEASDLLCFDNDDQKVQTIQPIWAQKTGGYCWQLCKNEIVVSPMIKMSCGREVDSDRPKPPKRSPPSLTSKIRRKRPDKDERIGNAELEAQTHKKQASNESCLCHENLLDAARKESHLWAVRERREMETIPCRELWSRREKSGLDT